MTELFRICGQVQWLDSAPAAGVTVVLCDADLVADDIIAQGLTDNDGRFCSTFTRDAFNQEMLENEAHPDLYLVVLLKGDKGWVPVRRFDFPRSTERSRDLGTVTLMQRRGQVPRVPKARLRALALFKAARRVRLDGGLLADVLSEMDEAVSQLTGWSALTHKLEVLVVDDIRAWQSDTTASRFERPGELDAVRRKLIRESSGAHAVYAPCQDVVVLERAKVEALGLDGLKVIIGHELVHVGQFRRHPELLSEHQSLARMWWEDLPTVGAVMRLGVGEGRELPLDRIRQRFMFAANLEGYASYIESLLRKTYNCAVPLPHLSLLGHLFARRAQRRQEQYAAALVKSAPLSGLPPEMLLMMSAATYSEGLNAYLDRRRGDHVVPFDPTLRIAPGSIAPDSLAELERHARAGSATHQADLGMMLSEGLYVPKDVVAGERWLRCAAEQGVPTAANNLAFLFLFPRGQYEEAVRWYRVAADAGLSCSQTSLGLCHLKGLGTPQDTQEARFWLQKAAEAAEANGQYWYGLVILAEADTEEEKAAGSTWLRAAAAQGHNSAREVLASREVRAN